MFRSHEKNLYDSLLDNLLIISGFPIDPQSPLGKKRYNQTRDQIIAEIFESLDSLYLSDYQAKERIYLIDTAIKSGDLNVVKAVTELFITQGFSDDIRIPSKDNMEHPYRPTFWLPSIITRQSHIRTHEYKLIEEYLVQTLQIPKLVYIDGKNFSREQYLALIDKWKHEKNVDFFTHNNARKPRYRRHGLMDDIENFDKSTLKKKI